MCRRKRSWRSSKLTNMEQRTEECKIASRFCISDSHGFARRYAPSKSALCLGVYIHVPFCKQKCFYCDFPSYAGKEKFEEAYVHALIKEIQNEGARYVEKWGEPATIYIGGGTPSVLPNLLLGQLLDELLRTFQIQTPPPLGDKQTHGASAPMRSLMPWLVAPKGSERVTVSLHSHSFRQEYRTCSCVTLSTADAVPLPQRGRR